MFLLLLQVLYAIFMEAFSVITQLTKEQYSRLVLRQTYKQVYVRYLTIVGVIIFLTSILELLHIIHIYSETPVFQFIFGLLVLTFPLLIMSQSKKAYDSNQKLQHDIKYTFREENINIQTFSSYGTFDWSNIIKTEEIGNYLFLYSGKTAAEIIEINKLSKEQLDYIKSKGRKK